MCSENKELTIEEKRKFLYNKTGDLQRVIWDIERVAKQDLKAYSAAKEISDICSKYNFNFPLEMFRDLALCVLRQKESELREEVDQYIK